jgi:hypothetical protein
MLFKCGYLYEIVTQFDKKKEPFGSFKYDKACLGAKRAAATASAGRIWIVKCKSSGV